MPETEPADPKTVSLSDIDEVNSFRKIKYELGCDDLPAAILVLAGKLSWLGGHVNVNFPNSEYELDRVGKDISDTLETVIKDGAININLDGELFSSVRGQIDTRSETKPKKSPVKKATKKPRKR